MATKIIKNLNSDEVTTALTKAEHLQSNQKNPGSSERFTYLANFDGTNNIKEDPSYSNDRHPTAVGEIAKLGREAQQTSENFVSRYYPGVGTHGTEPGSSLFPAVQAIATAEKAYQDLQFGAAKWLKTHPNGEVTTMLTCFSRAAATAAIFSQMLYERGLKDPDNPDVQLIPPGKIGVSAGLVISPVTTGTLGLNIAFAPNVTNMVNVLAENEYRENYIQNVYMQPGFRDVWLTGNHCDIGATYDNGLGALYLQKYTEFFRDTGLPLGEVRAERQFNPAEAAIHKEAVTPSSPWNYAYGSLEEDTPIRTRVAGDPASFTDDTVDFTLYNGQKISQEATELPWFADHKAEFDAWQDAIRELEEDAKELQQQEEATAQPKSSQEISSQLTERDAQAEAAQKAEVQAAHQVRAADLQIMQAQESLSAAVASGNTLEIVRTGLEYFSNLEKRADLGADGRGRDSGCLSESTEALADSLAGAIRLGQAIDSGNGLAIAGQSINLLQGIDRYVAATTDNGAHFLDNGTAGILGVGAAGIGLAQAIDAENEWGIVQSSFKLLEEINDYAATASAATNAANSAGEVSSSLGGAAGVSGTTGQALSGIGSAVGLVMNVTQLDDVFESGNAAQIAYTVASTANNAINTYNAVASLAGYSGLQTIPGLGYVGAVVQLMQGDVLGAAISALTTYLMCCGPYGWIAAAVIQIVSMIAGDKDPAEATAVFSLDENGRVVLETHGDKSMRGTAENCANPMVSVMESYQAGGGRLLIDGSLPSFRVVDGEKASITYRNEAGGRVSVIIGDMSRVLEELQTVLIARDRGERLESAVRVARDVHGDIDLAQVDAIMAGHGFTKNGITFTYGETGDVRGVSTGSGVFRGGGNMGPEGQHFTATHMQSLPLREEQLPSQRMGEILKIIGLNNTFAGTGSPSAMPWLAPLPPIAAIGQRPETDPHGWLDPVNYNQDDYVDLEFEDSWFTDNTALFAPSQPIVTF